MSYRYTIQFGQGDAHQASGRGSTPDERVPNSTAAQANEFVEIVRGWKEAYRNGWRRGLGWCPWKVESDQPAYCALIDLLPVANEDTVHLCDPSGEHSRRTKEKDFEVDPEESIVITPGEQRT